MVEKPRGGAVGGVGFVGVLEKPLGCAMGVYPSLVAKLVSDILLLR